MIFFIFALLFLLLQVDAIAKALATVVVKPGEVIEEVQVQIQDISKIMLGLAVGIGLILVGIQLITIPFLAVPVVLVGFIVAGIAVWQIWQDYLIKDVTLEGETK